MDKSGMSLVEVLVAMTVLLLVALAMMQTALVGIDSNVRNVSRDEAVSLAADRIDYFRNLTDSVRTGLDNTTETVGRHMRSATVEYTVYNTVTSVGDNDSVQIMVEWTWKGEIYNTTLSTIMD
jgi:prepilin-type N-terminal cleavage/methylation domain-containing protein